MLIEHDCRNAGDQRACSLCSRLRTGEGRAELAHGELFGFGVLMFMFACSFIFMLACTFAFAGLGDDVTVVFALTLTFVFSVVVQVAPRTAKVTKTRKQIILRISVPPVSKSMFFALGA